MAKRESICSLIEVEHRVALLRTFVDVVSSVDQSNPPDWTHLALHLVGDLERELERLGRFVRGTSC